MSTFIYALTDPNTSEVRYVGKSDYPLNRLFKHLQEARNNKGRNKHKIHWIQSLLSNGLIPQLVILEEILLEEDWEGKEQYWINYYRQLVGDKLTNIADGGQGHVMKGENNPNYGKPNFQFAEFTRRRNIENPPMLGKKRTLETREKISKAHKGKKSSATSARNKLNPPFAGKKHSENTKHKMSEVAKNRPIHPWQGRQHTEETKEKMRQVAKRRWNRVNNDLVNA